MSLFKEQRMVVRDKILETSIALFREHGYGKVSIEQITRSIGIAKGTFYNFFTTKRDILMAWAESVFSLIDVRQATDPGRSVKENLFRLIEILCDGMAKEGPLFSSFLGELFQSYADEKSAGRFDVMSLFRAAVESSEGYETIGDNIEEKMDVLNNATFLAVINWFGSGKTAEGLEQHLKNVVSVCLYGIMPR